MKNIVAISLVIAFCFQVFIKIWIVQYYQINKDFIAAVLCINKEIPEMKCDGKCFLKKQLKKQDEQEKKSPNSVKEKIETFIFLELNSSFYSAGFFIPYQIKFPRYIFGIYTYLVFGIFHPPKVV